MRSLLILLAVFAAGFLIGREFWPDPHPDPGFHLRFHRGKIPGTIAEPQTTNKPPAQHGRILHKPQPADKPATN